MSYCRIRRTIAITVAAFALAAISAVPSWAQAPKKGGEMHIAVVPEPIHLGLGMTGQLSAYTISSKIYQPLIKYDYNFKPIPVLAESWTQSPDGKTYTFKLRQGVKWHDGKPFTAHDVVFTTTEILKQYNPLSRRVIAMMSKVSAPDDHTVVFEFPNPYPAFMSMFDPASMPVLPKHLYEGTEYTKNPYNEKPVGTGPFKFVEWKKGSFVKLVRNDDYWKPGLPYLDALYFEFIPDAAGRALALEQGKVHLTAWGAIENYDVPRLKALPHLEMTTKGYEMIGTMMWVEFNHRKAPFNDIRFRRAISHAIDREFIRNNIYFGLGKIPTSPVSTVTKFHEKDTGMAWDFNPAKAKKMLDDMGLKPDANGIRLKTTLTPLYASLGEQYVRIGEYMKQALKDVGIDAEIKSYDAGGWMKAMGNWEYDIAVNFMGQYADPELGVARSYISSNIKQGVPFNNMAGYSNPKIDDLFAKGAAEPDEKKRAAIYSELQKVLVDDVAYVWFLELEQPHFINKKFKNVITNPLGNKDDFEAVYKE